MPDTKTSKNKNKTILPILVDTREQNPFNWEKYEGIRIYQDTLEAADYTLVGHEFYNEDDSVLVEKKKNCLELVTNLCKKWDQFEKELVIMSQYKHKCIVVCGEYNFWEIYTQRMTKVHPNFVNKRLSEIYLNYGVPTLFLKNRSTAEDFVFRMFCQIYNKHYLENTDE